jgi:GT2 family glycosyltransferase
MQIKQIHAKDNLSDRVKSMKNDENFFLGNLSYYQEMIESYRENFLTRSDGHRLPKIEFMGQFIKKSSTLTTESYFIAIPVKNQEKVIKKVLTTLFSHVNNEYSLGIIFDNCTDASYEIAFNLIAQSFASFPHLKRVYLIKSYGELFESTCENILFEFCNQDYFVSLQSDMYFVDSSFLSRAKCAFESSTNLLAITGKAVIKLNKSTILQRFLGHLLKIFTKKVGRQIFNQKIKKLGFFSPLLGYFGDRAQAPYSKMHFTQKEFRKLYIGEAIIRGPIIWKAEIFRELNGFNDVAFYLGRDECDLSLRGNLNGFFVAYMPCLVYSIYEEGTTRKPRNSEVEKAIVSRNNLSKKNPGYLHRYWLKNLEASDLQKLKRNKKIIKNSYGYSINLLDKS